MSDLISVFVEEVPDKLIQPWVEELSRYGLQCEIELKGDFEERTVIADIKMQVLPEAFHSAYKYGNRLIKVGFLIEKFPFSCEERFDQEFLRSLQAEKAEVLKKAKYEMIFPANRTLGEFLIEHYGSATFASVTNGLILLWDDINSQSLLLTGLEAMPVVKEFVENRASGDRNWAFNSFIFWDKDNPENDKFEPWPPTGTIPIDPEWKQDPDEELPF